MAVDSNGKAIIALFDESWKKHRAFKTVSLFATFFSLGLGSSVLGPTIVSMEVLLNTTTERISTTFTGAAVGYLLGAILCGFIYPQLNKEMLFAFSLIGVGVTMAYAPFSPCLIVFVVVNSCQSVFMGIIDTAGQSYLLRLWQDHRYRRPLMQCLHGVWSVGATVGPIIVHGFLVDISLDVDEVDDRNVTTTAPELYFVTENSTEEAYTVSSVSASVKLVRIPYVIVASIVAASSVLFVIIFFLVGSSCLDPSRKRRGRGKDGDIIRPSKTYRRIYVRFLALLFCFFFFQIWMEGIPSSLVAVFVVKGLGWPNDHGALITSLYLAFHGLSRILAIPLAAILSPPKMLVINMTVVSIGYGLLFFVDYHRVIPWIAVSVSGLGIGSAFPSGVLWAESFIQVTSAASSVFVTSMSFGSMIGPALTGFLMGYFTYMCFVYVLIAAAVMLMAVNLSVVFYAKRAGLRNKSSRNSKALPGTSQETASLNPNPNNLQDKSSPARRPDDNIAVINSSTPNGTAQLA